MPPKRILTRPSPYRKNADPQAHLPVTPLSASGKKKPARQPRQLQSQSAQTSTQQPQQPSAKAKGKARAQSDDEDEDEDENDIVQVRSPSVAVDSPRAISSEAARMTMIEPPRHKTPPPALLARPLARSPGAAARGARPQNGPSAPAGTSAAATTTAAPAPAPVQASATKRPAPQSEAAAVVASTSKRVRIQEPPPFRGPDGSPSPTPSDSDDATGTSSDSDSDSDSGSSSSSEGEFLLIEHADALFQEILGRPKALRLDEISALFVRLQETSFRFSLRHFDYELTAEQEAAWPLHLLSTQYKPLMLMTQFIADGSHCGWRNFFTKREHRVPLLHGIIGEWCKHRIFNHTAFGVPELQQEQLEAVDRDFLHYDAFVRSKKRAEVLEVLKFGYGDDSDDEADPYFPEEHANNLDMASFELAGHLLQLIEPLLPPPIYDPARGNLRTVGAGDKEHANALHHTIFMELVELIRLSASLHLCIRLTGLDGTIVRIAPHVIKGSAYDMSPDANHICVNADFVNSTKPQPLGPRDALQVKMTCWGRVEAVVPHGPDRLELEEEVRKLVGEEGKITWRDVEDQVFPVLPYDLQKSNAGRAAVEGDRPVQGTEWSIRMARAAVEENKYTYGKKRRDGDGDSDDESPSSSDADADADGDDGASPRAPKPARGSFVTVYPNVAPANVYCVWVKDARPLPSRPGVTPIDQAQTLEQAVHEARKAKGLYYRVEDLGIHTVNLALEYQAYEWALATGLLGGITTGTLLLALKAAASSKTGLVPLESVRARCVQLARDMRNGVPMSLSTSARYFSTLRDTLHRSGERVKTALDVDFSALTSLLRPSALRVVPVPRTTTLTSTVTGWTTVTVPPTGVSRPPLTRLSRTTVWM